MSWLKKAVGIAASPVNALSGGMVGGGSTGSAILSGIPFLGEGFAAQQKMAFEEAQSAKQMAFQERMSNTAHQRETADLEAAGLNRILSANAGASTPPGSMASGSDASGASSSAQMAKSLINQERASIQSTIGVNRAQKELLQTKAQGEKYQNVEKKLESEMIKDAGPLYQWLKKLVPMGTSAAKAYRGLKPVKNLKPMPGGQRIPSSPSYKNHPAYKPKSVNSSKSLHYENAKFLNSLEKGKRAKIRQKGTDEWNKLP